jgi:hypothetical protein
MYDVTCTRKGYLIWDHFCIQRISEQDSLFTCIFKKTCYFCKYEQRHSTACLLDHGWRHVTFLRNHLVQNFGTTTSELWTGPVRCMWKLLPNNLIVRTLNYVTWPVRTLGKSKLCFNHYFHCGPVRIRSSTSPRVSYKATKWGGPSDETGKTEVPCRSRCGLIKIPPCSEALSAEHRPKFCSPSPAMATSPYKRNILERDVKP